MIIAPHLLPAVLLRRYKRFLADVRLANGDEITVHCPNTGSMRHCAEPGSRVWLSDSQNPARKYRYTWEWVEVQQQYRACINTQRANALVDDALQQGIITPLSEYPSWQREPRVADGRLDFLLTGEGLPDCYLEVKNVTLLEGPGEGCFPDAVSARGLKHLHRLASLCQQGQRAVLLFCVAHEGIEWVRAAEEIDPAYAHALREVHQQGVEVYAYRVAFGDNSMALAQPITVRLS